MTSSRRVIKSSYAIEDLEESLITTSYEAEPEEYEGYGEIVNESSPEVSEADQLLQETESEATQILATAQKEAEALKTQAEELGYTNGEKAGFEQGFQNGFNEGVNQADAAYQEKEAHLRQMLESANNQLNAYKEEVKEELLDLAIAIAGKITHQQIDTSELGVLEIAKPYFYQLDKNEEMVILKVHPEALDKVHKTYKK